MSYNQPDNWNERATVRDPSLPHQLILTWAKTERVSKARVSCNCMPPPEVEPGLPVHPEHRQPIAEIQLPGDDPWVSYDQYHREVLGLPVEEYRPGARAVIGMTEWSSVVEAD